VFRNYLHGGVGQAEKQIDTLADVGKALGNTDARYWEMQNGYALPRNSQALRELGAKLEADPALVERAQAALRVGVHWSTQVAPPATHRVAQVYASALPVACAGDHSGFGEVRRLRTPFPDTCRDSRGAGSARWLPRRYEGLRRTFLIWQVRALARGRLGALRSAGAARGVRGHPFRGAHHRAHRGAACQGVPHSARRRRLRQRPELDLRGYPVRRGRGVSYDLGELDV
jgi:hypothetical protein